MYPRVGNQQYLESTFTIIMPLSHQLIKEHLESTTLDRRRRRRAQIRRKAAPLIQPHRRVRHQVTILRHWPTVQVAVGTLQDKVLARRLAEAALFACISADARRD